MFIRLFRRVLLALLSLTMITLTACGGGTPPAHEGSEPDFAAVDEFVGAALAETRTPGAALAVVTPEGIVHRQAWGVDGDGAEITAETPFFWGSVAKPVAAAVTLILVERGQLDLDRPVRDYLPAFRTADPDHTRQVTLRHLLNHTSGLPAAMSGVTDIVDPERRPADVLDRLAEIEPNAEPGARFQYTSVDYAVLAAVIEEVTQERYQSLARELLLDPIGADSAITTTEEATAVPRGHRYVMGNPTPFRTGFDPAGVSYGYLGGSLEDLARFAQLNLAQGTLDGTEVISEESLRETWTDGVRMSETRDELYALGWRTRQLDGGSEIIWHSGGAPGYFAHLILLPEQEQAVVLLQNAHGELQALDEHAAAFGAADLLAGDSPEPPSAGWTYPLVIMILTALVLAAAAGLVVTIARWRRPEGVVRGRVARVAGWALLGVILWAVVLAVPGRAGIPWPQFLLWNPDVPVLVLALVIITTLLVLGRILRLLRPRE